MRTRVWWLIGLMVALLGSGSAQSLVLTNGDVNSDNQVDDADLVPILFAMGQSCPSGCPEDLNGDGVVNDADLVIVLFNLGAQGAPAFAGQVQSPQGAFSVSLTVRLGDWAGSAQQVKVQLKPVGRESDATVPIFEYRVSVGGTDTTVQLANLPAGAYTVRAFAEASGRWLRTEGKLITEVPWIFAVPTGANKVTVYWDEVSGATGYRVRWGTASRSYPNTSAVLPATARQHTVSGLISEQEYYFVVEAEYNGLWNPPSEEDSAIPHVGAIPWDTQDPNEIIPAVLQAIGEPTWQDVEILSPDELYYDQTSGSKSRTSPPVYFHPAGWITDERGNILVASAPRSGAPNNCHPSGPYVQVRAETEIAVGARGQFWVPPTAGVYSGIRVDDNTRLTTRDAPYIYFGISDIIEGGVYYMRANWGYLDSQSGAEVGAPNYERWIPFTKYNKKFHKPDRPVPMVGSPKKVLNHIPYHTSSAAQYGLIFEIEFIADVKKKQVVTKVRSWSATDDAGFGDPLFEKPFVLTAKEVRRLPNRESQLEIRQTVSIAQNRLRSQFCARTDTRFGLWRNFYGQRVPVGVGRIPIGQGIDLLPVQLMVLDGQRQRWVDWQVGRLLLCPSNISGAANYRDYAEWHRGYVWITTQPCPPLGR